MTSMDRDGYPHSASASRLATTHWSVVLAAGTLDSPERQKALETLCGTYWLPVYAYIRRKGYNGSDAEDLTQAFLVHMLTSPLLHRADPRAGKFRCLLITALKHFMINESQRAHAEKRGGKYRFLPLEEGLAEKLCSVDVHSRVNAGVLFDRKWAVAVLDRAFERLRTEWVQRRKTEQFEQLKVFLSQEGNAADYERVAEQLDTKTGTVPVIVHRLRRRYGDLVRDEIAQTVSTPLEVEEEVRYLLEIARQQADRGNVLGGSRQTDQPSPAKIVDE